MGGNCNFYKSDILKAMARRPLDGTPTITQVWGEPNSMYRSGRHSGVDYGVPTGTPIKSPTNGSVFQVGDGRASTDGRGFFMKIRGDDGIEHNLYHLARWHVSSGRVTEGQHVADSDNTGMSTGSHLHWETRRSPYNYGDDFNPADWLYAPQQAPTAPTTSLQPNQRILENTTGVYQRTAPQRSAAIIKDWPYDTSPFEFKAYVRGESVNGNDIWYVGKYSGGYFWSGAFVDKSTNGLPDQTPSPTPIPAPDPAPVEPIPTDPADMPVDFKPDDATVISVHASPDIDEYPTQTPKFIVIHHWGDPAKNISRQSVINTMTEDNGLSVQYVADDSGIYQCVPENKRAQHAGPQGNDGIGIECDPNGGDAMYTHLRLLVANIRVRWGRLELRKHSEFMATACPGKLELLRIEPISVPPNVDYAQENNNLLKQILNIVQSILNKITGVFR